MFSYITSPSDYVQTETVSDSVRLGEITPFEALEKQNKTIKIPKLKCSSTVKKNKRADNKELQSSDEDYIPEINDVSTDDNNDNEADKGPKKVTGKKKREKAKLKSKYLRDLKKPRRRRVVDDGNFDCFKERIK